MPNPKLLLKLLRTMTHIMVSHYSVRFIQLIRLWSGLDKETVLQNRAEKILNDLLFTFHLGAIEILIGPRVRILILSFILGDKIWKIKPAAGIVNNISFRAFEKRTFNFGILLTCFKRQRAYHYSRSVRRTRDNSDPCYIYTKESGFRFFKVYFHIFENLSKKYKYPDDVCSHEEPTFPPGVSSQDWTGFKVNRTLANTVESQRLLGKRSKFHAS